MLTTCRSSFEPQQFKLKSTRLPVRHRRVKTEIKINYTHYYNHEKVRKTGEHIKKFHKQI